MYASIGSTVAGVITHPLDTIKVTIQVEMGGPKTPLGIMQVHFTYIETKC
jgi:hypothetical protein